MAKKTAAPRGKPKGVTIVPRSNRKPAASRKSGEGAFTQFRHVLVPVDFSDNSKRALRFAIQFIRNLAVKLKIMYVVEPMVYPPDFSFGQIAYPNLEEEVTKRAQSELEKLIESEVPKGAKVEAVVVTGKPFAEIINYASGNSIDLIIIATHGTSAVEHLLFGSTAEKVVRKATCPVLVLRGKPEQGS